RLISDSNCSQSQSRTARLNTSGLRLCFDLASKSLYRAMNIGFIVQEARSRLFQRLLEAKPLEERSHLRVLNLCQQCLIQGIPLTICLQFSDDLLKSALDCRHAAFQIISQSPERDEFVCRDRY